MNYEAMRSKLRGEYSDVLERAEIYGIAKNINSEVQDEMMMNLFDILLSSQEDNKPVEKIVGNDMEKFLEDYYEGYTIGERLKMIPKELFRLMKILFVFELLDTIFMIDEGVSFFQVETDISWFIVGIICGIIITTIGYVISNNMLKKKKVKVNVIYGIIIALFVLSCIVLYNVVDKFQIQIKSYVSIIISFVYIVIYIVVRSIYRYKKTGSIHREKSPESEYGKPSISGEIEKTLPDEMVKKFYKMNKKNAKKGKPEITSEEYMELIRKETDKLAGEPKKIAVMYVGICVIFTAIIAIDSTFPDILIFVAIISVIEFLIWYMLAKANRAVVNARRRLINKCDELGVNIIEYADMNKNV